jgi:hypothetical protein
MAAKRTTKPKPSKRPTAKKAPANKPRVSAKAAADKARREREIYKVSPLRGMPIGEWIAKKTTGWQSDVVRRIVRVVEQAAPDATCEIKWGQPVFDHGGPFAFVKPAKAHLSVGFWRGSEVADPKGILERGDRMGHFKLRAASELDEGALAAMVRDAVRLNREKGSPTRRA